MAARAERTLVDLAEPREAERGKNGVAVRPLADPAALHLRTDKPRGLDTEWRRTGQAEQWVASLGPTFAHR